MDMPDQRNLDDEVMSQLLKNTIPRGKGYL